MVFFSHLLQLSCNSPTALLSLLRQSLRKKLTKRNGIKHYILTDYSKQRDHITVQTHRASPLPGNTYCEPRCSTVLVRKLPNTTAQQCKNEKKGFTIEKLVVCTVHVEVIAAPKNSVLCTQVYFSSGRDKLPRQPSVLPFKPVLAPSSISLDFQAQSLSRLTAALTSHHHLESWPDNSKIQCY